MTSGFVALPETSSLYKCVFTSLNTLKIGKNFDRPDFILFIFFAINRLVNSSFFVYFFKKNSFQYFNGPFFLLFLSSNTFPHMGKVKLLIIAGNDLVTLVSER